MYEKETYHFLVLHFPIALFITGFIFDILYTISDKSELKNYVFWTMGMGILWSIISIITGYITALELEYITSIINIVDKKHSLIMISSTLAFILLFYIKKRNLNQKIILLLHAVAVSCLIYGTHLGAKWADRI